MNNNKFFTGSMLITTSFLITVASSSVLADVLDYKLSLAEDGSTYEVWMQPSMTPEPDISLTGQLTLKVPTASQFKAVDIANAVEGAEWIEASRVNAPDEASDFDYISFSYIGLQGNSAHNYQWRAGEEKLVFTFKNDQGCVDGVSIMGNDDPFNIADNSANTNPGNQFTNLGWGSVGANHFNEVYGKAIKCAN